MSAISQNQPISMLGLTTQKSSLELVKDVSFQNEYHGIKKGCEAELCCIYLESGTINGMNVSLTSF